MYGALLKRAAESLRDLKKDNDALREKLAALERRMEAEDLVQEMILSGRTHPSDRGEMVKKLAAGEDLAVYKKALELNSDHDFGRVAGDEPDGIDAKNEYESWLMNA